MLGGGIAGLTICIKVTRSTNFLFHGEIRMFRLRMGHLHHKLYAFFENVNFSKTGTKKVSFLFNLRITHLPPFYVHWLEWLVRGRLHWSTGGGGILI